MSQLTEQELAATEDLLRSHLSFERAHSDGDLVVSTDELASKLGVRTAAVERVLDEWAAEPTMDVSASDGGGKWVVEA